MVQAPPGLALEADDTPLLGENFFGIFNPRFTPQMLLLMVQKSGENQLLCTKPYETWDI